MRRGFLLILLALGLCVAGVVVASCGGEDESAGPTTTVDSTTETTTSETTTETTTTETATTETTQPAPAPPVVRIRVIDGAPEGGIVRETVEQGDRVVLVVTSDVSDHIHLHGYDVLRDVRPGETARLAFRATIPGRFEVELEDRGVQIADITVTT